MGHTDQDHALFTEEYRVLENAGVYTKEDRFKDNELLPKYRELAESYASLLSLVRKVFRISDVQGKVLKKRESEIKNILDNSNQGFLTFGKDLTVNREYSSECIRIFNKKIANANIVELLSSDSHNQGNLSVRMLKEIFSAEDAQARAVLIQELPSVIKVNDGIISVKYKFIARNEIEVDEDTILLVLTDITEKCRAEDQVLYLSYHDKLTALYNRAYIESILPQLHSAACMPLSIIMADMNGLKLTNDVFGHENGDKLLKDFAGVLLNCCRKNDIAARWGGDEFLIFLPGTDKTACEAICAGIKKMCGSMEPDPIKLSASLGTATMENTDTCIPELYSIAENRMYKNKICESGKVRRDIILGMGKVLQNKCFEHPDHMERVGRMALEFAGLLNTETASIDLEAVSLLASLHDIGKVGIPGEILGKPGALTKNEWKIMQGHTEIGFRMAQSIEEQMLARAILALREHWNGGGYPYGLKQGQIPLISRLFAIVDAYDVMTHDRPYKRAVRPEEAVAELARCSGEQFDPELVKIFLDNIGKITANSGVL